jgi:hypothetical protein
LKVLIFSKTGIPPSNQRLTYNGKKLVDHLPLAIYHIRSNSLLHLSSTLLGGHKQPSRRPKRSSQARAARHMASLQQCQADYKQGLHRLNRPIFPSAEELCRSPLSVNSQAAKLTRNPPYAITSSWPKRLPLHVRPKKQSLKRHCNDLSLEASDMFPQRERRRDGQIPV